MYRGYFFFFLLFTVTLSAQAPQKINFQAVLRGSDGTLLTNQSIAFRVYILSASPTGAVVYTEAHQKTTDAAGLVSLQIGGGTALFGVFQTINWSTGTYFAKLEADLSGESNFSTLVIQELMSVPYALYASKADTALKSKPEVDPLFTQSTASGITSTDTAKWNQLAAYLEQLNLRIDSLQMRISVLEQSDTNQNALPEYVPTDSLIGWWPFNGNAKDASGNGNDGTVVGAVLAGDRFGNYRKAYSFDGTNDFIRAQSAIVTGTISRTFSVWFTSYNSSSSSDKVIIDEGGSTCGSGFALLHDFADNIIFDNTCARKLFNQTFNLNTWNHLVIVFDNSISLDLSGIKCYLNGIEVVSSQIINTLTLDSGNSIPLTIGKSRLENNQYFLGLLDDIGIWNRALTPQEISNLYHATY